MSSTSAGKPAVSAAPSEDRRWLHWYDADVPPHLSYPHIPIFQLLDDSAAKYDRQDFAAYPAGRGNWEARKALTQRQVSVISLRKRFDAEAQRSKRRNGNWLK